MSTIDKRTIVNTMYRVRIRPEGLPSLYLTFSCKEDAENWIDEHEEIYISNPKPYQEWIKANRKSIKLNGIFHVYIPLEKFLN